MTKISEIAHLLGKRRWKGIPEEEIKRLVPRNGGRKRIYPQCVRYKAHRFTNDRCPCGYRRRKTHDSAFPD